MINNCLSRTLHVEVCLAWMITPAGTVRFMQDKKKPTRCRSDPLPITELRTTAKSAARQSLWPKKNSLPRA